MNKKLNCYRLFFVFLVYSPFHRKEKKRKNAFELACCLSSFRQLRLPNSEVVRSSRCCLDSQVAEVPDAAGEQLLHAVVEVGRGGAEWAVLVEEAVRDEPLEVEGKHVRDTDGQGDSRNVDVLLEVAGGRRGDRGADRDTNQSQEGSRVHHACLLACFCCWCCLRQGRRGGWDAFDCNCFVHQRWRCEGVEQGKHSRSAKVDPSH